MTNILFVPKVVFIRRSSLFKILNMPHMQFTTSLLVQNFLKNKSILKNIVSTFYLKFKFHAYIGHSIRQNS
jgi:hypothetical protein